MESVLEAQRSLHEEIERYELAITKELSEKLKTVLRDNRISIYLKSINEKVNELNILYEDRNGARKAEIESLKVGAELGEFMKRYKNLKEKHRNLPDAPAEIMEVAMNKGERQRHADEMEAQFTGEENFGKYLDLNVFYNQFINLKAKEAKDEGSIFAIDYLTYLDKYDAFDEIPQHLKSSGKYRDYLEGLFSYLRDFVKRSLPLQNIDRLVHDTVVEFDKIWQNKKHQSNGSSNELSNESNDDLFCVACAKQFSKKTVFDSHLTGKKHLAAAGKLKTDVDVEQLKQEKQKENEEKGKRRGFLEFIIKKISIVILGQQRSDTKASLERKQTLTLEEFAARGEEEKEEDIVVEESESEDEERDEKFYNPLKLPIGWDGKPIPFWLYKLHGLGKEYPCEICGNFVYMGRRAFEKHFQENRHTYGMRCLQIPNTVEFQEITKIADALALWDKLRAKNQAESFKAEMMEEFEDASGNVYNKRTFEDLKRQGIL